MTGGQLIENRVRYFGRRQNLIDAAALGLLTITGLLIGITVCLVLERSLVYSLVGLAALGLHRRRSLLDHARFLDQHLGLNGEIVNGLQLNRLPGGGRENYSPDLINAAVNAAAERIRCLNFNRCLSYRRLQRAAWLCLTALALALVPLALMPARTWRALHPAIFYRLTPETNRFLRGQEIKIRLHLFTAAPPRHVTMVWESEGRVNRTRLLVQDDRAEYSVVLNCDLKVFFEFAGRRTTVRRLSVMQPLIIRVLRLDLCYPAYTGRTAETQTRRTVVAPVGTEIKVSGHASQILDSARVEDHDTVSIPCTADSFSFRFTLREDAARVLHLFAGSDCREPLSFYAIPDLPPLVEIFFPGTDINLPEDMKTAIAVRCSDDYGLSRVSFYYTFKNDYHRILPLRHRLEDTLYFTWDLAELNLLPGDEVKYFVRVWDNNGHNSASKTLAVIFPTMEQIYEALRDQQDSIQDDFVELKSDHQEQQQAVERLRDKILRERDLSWRDQGQLQEIIKKESGIAEKIEQWQQELEKAVKELNQGLMLDQTAINRLQEINRILQEIAPEELKQALAELQAKMENRNPEEITRALENLARNQEELNRVLTRTLEILKRFQQETQLQELARQARELARKAEQLDAEAKRPDNANWPDSLAALKERIDRLAQALQNLAQSPDLEKEIAQKLDSLNNQARDLTAENMSEPGDQAVRLEQIAAALDRLYEEMTRSRTANLRRHLMETVNQLIDLSQSLESAMKEGNRDSELKEELVQAARAAADSLYGQQVKSLYVTPGMGKKLSRAINEMNQAALQNRLGQSGAVHEAEAMRQINLTCVEIMENMKKAGAGGSATGMDELLQQLSSIAQGQMSLNQSLMGLLPLPGGLTPGAMASLRRLAGKQRELRQALQELSGRPEASRYQDLIENLTREMEKAEEQLYQYKIDRSLIERQKLIISRLLDAQKSIRQEDRPKERKSKPGKDEGRLVLTPLSRDLGRDELRELIQQALREPYPKDYELIIREYFRALLEETRQ